MQRISTWTVPSGPYRRSRPVCGGRRAGIDARINEVYEQVKQHAGDIPFIMEFTFGEYGYEDDGNNTCGGLMLSFTAFGK